MADALRDAMLRGYEHTAHYKGSIVWMKQYKSHVVLQKADYQQLKAVRLRMQSCSPACGKSCMICR